MTTLVPTSDNFRNTLIEHLAGNRTVNVSIVYKDGRKRSARLAIARDGSPIEMRKGSRKYGHYMDSYYFDSVAYLHIPDATTKDPSVAWQKSWTNVYSRLKVSGLNPRYAKTIETGLLVGYDKIQKAYEPYWNFKLSHEERNSAVEEVDKRLSDDIEILYIMHKPAKVEKMNFGWRNEEKLAHIAQCLRDKIRCSESGRTNYDISFEYNPETSGAFYSKEFRNCGNGHYYLALDATHAVFYEDD